MLVAAWGYLPDTKREPGSQKSLIISSSLPFFRLSLFAFPPFQVCIKVNRTLSDGSETLYLQLLVERMTADLVMRAYDMHVGALVHNFEIKYPEKQGSDFSVSSVLG